MKQIFEYTIPPKDGYAVVVKNAYTSTPTKVEVFAPEFPAFECARIA